jgi:catechol 2,3-dioxygenase-like lactoylglutathione lyase family enzyme
MTNLTYVSPFFIVANLEASVSFYTDKLGFEVRFAGPWARWDAYIFAEDPDTLFEEYRSGGVAFRQPIQDDGDGLRGFEIADADGYVLFFGRPNS